MIFDKVQSVLRAYVHLWSSNVAVFVIVVASAIG